MALAAQDSAIIVCTKASRMRVVLDHELRDLCFFLARDFSKERNGEINTGRDPCSRPDFAGTNDALATRSNSTVRQEPWREAGRALRKNSNGMSIDDMVRSTDITVHIMIIALLIAFAFVAWYFYGASTVAPPSSP